MQLDPPILTRDKWGAVPPRRRHLIDMPTPELYLHHSAGSGADEAVVRRIQDFHMGRYELNENGEWVLVWGRGWSDIAYSFLIDNDAPDIDIFEGRGAGVAGGHTKGRNTVSHAICVIGNFMRAEPHPMTLERLVDLAAAGYLAGWWREGFTGGHRDAPNASTSCPGDKLHALIPSLNTRISQKVEAYTMADLPFPDLEGYPAEVIEAVAWAKANGITAGTSATTFSPEANVTRAQLAVFLHRLHKLHE